MDIYVGMGLTQAPVEFRVGFQNELKKQLRRSVDITVLDFIGLEGGTPSRVYEYDRSCTEKADLCIFIVDHPSIGLGMEIAFRLASKKPMLVFAREEASVTRMLTGMCEVEGVKFFRYADVAEILFFVRSTMSKLSPRTEKSAT
jgi:hypothetical protein